MIANTNDYFITSMSFKIDTAVTFLFFSYRYILFA